MTGLDSITFRARRKERAAEFRRFHKPKIVSGLLALCAVALSLHGGVIFTNLVSFSGINAALPESALTQASDGNFYSTTLLGGIGRDGTFFRMTPEGALTYLTSFDGTNGARPLRTKLARDTNGDFYGTTYNGGADDLGTVFRATTNGDLTMLVSFTGANGPYPGANPASGLTLASDGYVYGATRYGGTSNLGTIFRMTPSGEFTNLVSFTGANGEFPASTLLWAGDGDFYGTTALGGSNGLGTIFRMTPDGALTTLFSFNGTNGSLLYGGLALNREGNFYGTTSSGGAGSRGTVFRMTAVGDFTSLFSFNGTNGRAPYGELALGGDGNFYGTTYEGGTNDDGTVFQVTPDGVLTTLVYFTNGLGPVDGLTLGTDGDFYGVTQGGGVYHRGSIFRLSVPMPPVFKTVEQSNGLITLTWSTAAGQTYQLQSKSDLNANNWTDVGNAVTSTKGNVTVSEPMNSGSRRFYRVALPP